MSVSKSLPRRFEAVAKGYPACVFDTPSLLPFCLAVKLSLPIEL